MGVSWWSSLIWPNVSTARGFWVATSTYTVAFLAVWAAIDTVLRLANPGKKDLCGVKFGTWALKAGMLLHHTPVGLLALAGLWQDPAVRQAVSCLGCAEAAQKLIRDPVGPCLAAQALTPITCGYMIADGLLISQWSLTKTGKLEHVLMIVHHVLSLASWPTPVYYDFTTRYVLVLLSYEVSSVFLTINWMLSTAGMKQSFGYFASGLLFTLSFVLLRLVGAVPQLLSMYTATPWGAAGWASEVPWWVVLGSSVMVVPHVLNSFWGIKVVRGFLSVVSGVTGKDSPRRQQGRHKD